jgi:hypothetical protein
MDLERDKVRRAARLIRVVLCVCEVLLCNVTLPVSHIHITTYHIKFLILILILIWEEGERRKDTQEGGEGD